MTPPLPQVPAPPPARSAMSVQASAAAPVTDRCTCRPARNGSNSPTRRSAAVDRAGCNLVENELADVAEDVFGIDVAVVEAQEWIDVAPWCEDDAKVAVLGTSPWPGWQRFALAHLMCHLLVEDEYELHVDASNEHLPTKRERSEVRANAFAEPS